MSLSESPTREKLDMSAGRLYSGRGMKLSAAVLLAFVESFLPTRTLQVGPPNCKLYNVSIFFFTTILCFENIGSTLT